MSENLPIFRWGTFCEMVIVPVDDPGRISLIGVLNGLNAVIQVKGPERPPEIAVQIRPLAVVAQFTRRDFEKTELHKITASLTIAELPTWQASKAQMDLKFLPGTRFGQLFLKFADFQFTVPTTTSSGEYTLISKWAVGDNELAQIKMAIQLQVS